MKAPFFSLIFLSFLCFSIDSIESDFKETIYGLYNFKSHNKLSNLPNINVNKMFVNNEPVYSYQFTSLTDTMVEKTLGHMPVANSKSRWIHRIGDEVVFDIVESYDQYHRRLNILPVNKTKHKKFVAIFGCSYAYGYGVNDDETINHYINKYSNNTYAYNYSIGATGTNVLLGLFEKHNFKRKIPIANGDFVYIFIDSHISRANGFMFERVFSKNGPKYEWQDDEMVRIGTIKDSEPVTHFLLSKLRSIYQYFDIRKDFPPVRESHLQYVCDLVGQARRKWVQLYPKGRFFFYRHPAQPVVDQYLIDCLKTKNIIVKIGEAGNNLNPNELSIPYDGHPNAKMNELVAEELLKEVENYKR